MGFVKGRALRGSWAVWCNDTLASRMFGVQHGGIGGRLCASFTSSSSSSSSSYEVQTAFMTVVFTHVFLYLLLCKQ